MSRDVVMLGFLVSDTAFNRDSALDPYPQIAARNLERGFLEGFIDNGLNIRLISSMPASTYPLNKKIFFGKEQWYIGSVYCQSLRYINLPGFKAVSRFISTLISLFPIFHGRQDNEKILCIYSLHSPYLLAANLLHRFLGVKYFVIVPDLPEFMSEGLGRSWFYTFFKRVDRNLIRFLIRRADGASVVASAMLQAMPELSRIPSVVIEGIALGRPSSNPEKILHAQPTRMRPYFLYAGGLNEAYGVGRLVRAFCASALDAELWLFGKGPLSQMVEDAAVSDDRIRYFGFVSQDKLREHLAGATALLLTRSSKDDFVQFSFPSKLIEYMMSGVPVITTRLRGIPVEYFGYLTVIDDDTEDGLTEVFKVHLNRGAEDRKKQAMLAYGFVCSEKTPKAQTAKFIKLINGYCEATC